MWHRSGLLAEEAREVRRIGEGQFFGDVVDQLRGEDELAFGRSEHTRALHKKDGGSPDGGPPSFRIQDLVVEPALAAMLAALTGLLAALLLLTGLILPALLLLTRLVLAALLRIFAGCFVRWPSERPPLSGMK